MKTTDMKPREFQIALAAAARTLSYAQAGYRYDVVAKAWVAPGELTTVERQEATKILAAAIQR